MAGHVRFLISTAAARHEIQPLLFQASRICKRWLGKLQGETQVLI
jgi:hypothetical protein